MRQFSSFHQSYFGSFCHSLASSGSPVAFAFTDAVEVLGGSPGIPDEVTTCWLPCWPLAMPSCCCCWFLCFKKAFIRLGLAFKMFIACCFCLGLGLFKAVINCWRLCIVGLGWSAPGWTTGLGTDCACCCCCCCCCCFQVLPDASVFEFSSGLFWSILSFIGRLIMAASCVFFSKSCCLNFCLIFWQKWIGHLSSSHTFAW